MSLVIHGGKPIREKPMPFRGAFGSEEENLLQEAIRYYRDNQIDPPYEGKFENQFCQEFVDFMGGGYADAVSSGTTACFIAIAALNLPKGSDVLISPVTDSGPLNSIIMLGLTPVLMESAPNSYNINTHQFLERITPNTSAIFVVHSAGEPVEIERITKEAHKRGIKVIEDCSQAPGAVCCGKVESCDRSCNQWKNRRVGSFGDTAAFSTMYRKTLTAGASGGVVYSKNEDTYKQILAHADRGKQTWRKDLNQNDPGQGLFPALNFNTDEFSCAIGIASLRKLQQNIDARNNFIKILKEKLQASTLEAIKMYPFHEGFSPFYHPIFVDTTQLNCTKIEFAEALLAEGIPNNTHYGCVISSWEYAKKYMKDDFVARNAEDVRDRSFNLFLNENYGEEEVDDIINAFSKLENAFRKSD